MTKQRVIAYIDGFNLFYSCLKGTSYKWLDLEKFCKFYLKPNQELVAVKYFSALVNSFKGDLSRTLRQDIYIQALRSNPIIEVQLGYFSVHRVKMPEANDFFINGKITPVEVAKTEEKGTDVNLAVQLVADAFHDRFDYAMLFSNDSDLTHAVRIAVKDCKKRVGLYIDRKAASFKVLKEIVNYVGRITPKILAANQLPDTINLPNGKTIKKPLDW